MIKSCEPDVMVDFSIAKASMPAIRTAAKNNVNLVIGTTGFTAPELDEMKMLAEANEIGIVAAPNFALGAVLMMHLAKIAGQFMDHAEIIELHHDKKLDAPSGTALLTARAMAEARGKPFLQPAVQDTKLAPPVSRGQGVEAIHIHSVRLPGLMAHQEVIFGAAGQTLSIRHDTINRECYMPGVILAIKAVVKQKGFTYGLDKLLGL
jgi:4-hydroxy-tetrahydrodipicolinate reductase